MASLLGVSRAARQMMSDSSRQTAALCDSDVICVNTVTDNDRRVVILPDRRLTSAAVVRTSTYECLVIKAYEF